MIRRPTGSTLTDTRFPYTTRVRSVPRVRARTGAARPVPRRRFGCAHEDCAPIEGREARCSPSIRQACLALLVLSAHIPIRQAAEEQSHFRSEEHTSELQSLMRISYAVFCLKKKKKHI